MPAGKDMSDEQKCILYPLFMSHLSHHYAHVAFWCLFALVLLLMCATSISYGGSHDCQMFECKKKGRKCSYSLKVKSKDDSKLNREERAAAENNRRISCQNRCLFWSGVWASAGTTAMIIGALAGLNLQFCWNEVLMSFLWCVWGVLQVGSALAMWGVFLHQLRMRLSPTIVSPWNVALGTPVLVIAGGAHWMYVSALAFVTKSKKAEEEDDDDEEDEEDDSLELLEFPDDGAIFKYPKKPSGVIPPGAILRHNQNGSWSVTIPRDYLEIWRDRQPGGKEVVETSVAEEQYGVPFSRAVTVRPTEDETSPAPLPRALVRSRST